MYDNGRALQVTTPARAFKLFLSWFRSVSIFYATYGTKAQIVPMA